MHWPGDLGRKEGRLASPPVNQPDGQGQSDSGRKTDDGPGDKLAGRDPSGDPGENRDDQQEAAGVGRGGSHRASMTAAEPIRQCGAEQAW